jgi:hypothetical protein
MPILTTVAQVHQLSADEAQRNYPVHLRAVVTATVANPVSLFSRILRGGIFIITSGWKTESPYRKDNWWK